MPHALRRASIHPVAACVMDTLLVVGFAAAGRASHDEEQGLSQVLGTAWPFLAGMAVGWVLVALWRRRAALTVSDGVVVWLATVVLGMLLRWATDAGTAWPFVIVAFVVVALLLIGWRAIAGLLLRGRSAARPVGTTG